MRQLLFALVLMAALSVVASADMEIRRTVSAPGDVVFVLPPEIISGGNGGKGVRRIRLDFFVSPQTSISALVMWTPQDHLFSSKLVQTGNISNFSNASNEVQIMAHASGQSPVVMGARSDSAGGRHSLVIEDASASSDTVTLTVSLGWTPVPFAGGASSGSRVGEAGVSNASTAQSRTTGLSAPENLSGGSGPDDALHPSSVGRSGCRIAGISWREGADIDRAVLDREGLRVRFTSPVNEEPLRKAIRIELGFPGSQDGLMRYEESSFDLKAVADGFVVILPRNLIFSCPTPMRITIDGDKVLSKDGSPLNAEGNGTKFPTGDGRPGGVFRSTLRIVP